MVTVQSVKAFLVTIRQLRVVEKQISFGAVSEAHSHAMLVAMILPTVVCMSLIRLLERTLSEIFFTPLASILYVLSPFADNRNAT
jgi:hypothetical protein